MFYATRRRRRRRALEHIAVGPMQRPLDPLEDRLALWRETLTDRRLRRIFDRTAMTIDREANRTLQDKYRSLISATANLSSYKYLDHAFFIQSQAGIAAGLNLDRRPPCSILDIGSGGGHLLAIAKAFGHRVTALDLPEPEIYRDLIALAGIPRIDAGIKLGESLPPEAGRYDVIVMNCQIFDTVPRSRARWQLPEWASFLEYLSEHHLNMPGEIFLGLNKSAGPTWQEDYFWPLVDLCGQHGAQLSDGPRIHFRLRTPLRFEGRESRPWFEWAVATTRQSRSETAHRRR